MSSFHYLNLEKNEKEIFLPKLFDILKLFCRNKDELCILIDDLQKNVKKLDDFCDVEDEKEEEEVESMKKKKKIIEVKKKEWKWVDLSPNVIVYNVLPFRLIESDEIKHKFDLYGYFKLDRLRNIWFVFISVQICNSQKIVPFYINIERLTYFYCHDTFFRNNENESLNFRNLKSIDYTQSEISPTIESIQKNYKFQKLKSIEIYLEMNEQFNVINLQGIENLRIWNGEWLLLVTNNLKLLELNYVDLKGYENWGQLINVEKLKMNYCENVVDLNSFFKVHKFEKLKKFTFYHGIYINDLVNDRNVDNSLENVRVIWDYLQNIQISQSGVNMDGFFINNEFKNLKTIKLSYLSLITGNKWKLSNSIRSFHVEDCKNFEQSIFKRKEMKNVEKISCINCLKINSEIDIFKKKIEELNYKKENSNLKNLIKKTTKYVIYKKKDDELCNLKILVLDDETY